MFKTVKIDASDLEQKPNNENSVGVPLMKSKRKKSTIAKEKNSYFSKFCIYIF